jgi:acetyltransferase-like isoleucine patch superfamily enzyme
VILGDQSCVRERVTIGDDVVVGRGSLSRTTRRSAR